MQITKYIIMKLNTFGRVFCHLKNRWNWIRNQQHLRIRKSATHRTWAITECRNIGTCFPINNGSSVGSSVRRSYYLKCRNNFKNIIYCKCVLLSLQLLPSKYVLLVWDQHFYFLIKFFNFLEIKFFAWVNIKSLKNV